MKSKRIKGKKNKQNMMNKKHIIAGAVAVIAAALALIIVPTLQANKNVKDNQMYRAELIYSAYFHKNPEKVCVQNLMKQNIKKQEFKPEMSVLPLAVLQKNIKADFKVYCDSYLSGLTPVYESSDTFALWSGTGTGSIHKEVRNLVSGDQCRVKVNLKCGGEKCDYSCSSEEMALNIPA